MKVTVFDFDGVLADSFEILYGLNREAMSLVQIELTRDKYRDLFGTNIHQGFKDFIPNEESYAKFINYKKENFGRRYQEVKLFPGILDVILNLSKQYILAISSSTPKEFIDELLLKNGIDGCFKYIIGNQDHSKAAGIEEIRKNLNCELSEMVMVSDTTADIAVAKNLGMATAAVTWGFHDVTKLSAATPDLIINNPADLTTSLTSL